MAQPVSRDAIVRTAVDLMLERGLAAVTLRRIATELGVSAPTLYWHIASKRELLDHVAEHLIHHCRTGFADAPAHGQPWWEWLQHRARVMYELMVSVRDAPQVVAGNRPTLEHLGEMDHALGHLVAAGFPPAEALEVFFVIGGYIGGMALEAQAEAARAGEGADDTALAAALADAERYPNLAAASAARTELKSRSRPDSATFDYGLGLLIRGIRARHDELHGLVPPAGELPAAGQRPAFSEARR